MSASDKKRVASDIASTDPVTFLHQIEDNRARQICLSINDSVYLVRFHEKATFCCQ